MARAPVLTYAAALPVLLGGAVACAPESSVRTVVLLARHSRFEPAVVEVPRGTTVRFVVRNVDPIDHELIVGDAATQERHERGTEPAHGDRPGEVSVAAESEAATTVRFPRSGEVPYGCHLPGHWAYGMRGVVRVR